MWYFSCEDLALYVKERFGENTMSYFDDEVYNGASGNGPSPDGVLSGTPNSAGNASSVGSKPSAGITDGAGKAPSGGAEPSTEITGGNGNELDDMCHDIGDAVGSYESDVDKVFVKKDVSNEGGYGTVLGVVMVIVSISFILAALFIRMLI